MIRIAHAAPYDLFREPSALASLGFASLRGRFAALRAARNLRGLSAAILALVAGPWRRSRRRRGSGTSWRSFLCTPGPAANTSSRRGSRPTRRRRCSIGAAIGFTCARTTTRRGGSTANTCRPGVGRIATREDAGGDRRGARPVPTLTQRVKQLEAENGKLAEPRRPKRRARDAHARQHGTARRSAVARLDHGCGSARGGDADGCDPPERERAPRAPADPAVIGSAQPPFLARTAGVIRHHTYASGSASPRR